MENPLEKQNLNIYCEAIKALPVVLQELIKDIRDVPVEGNDKVSITPVHAAKLVEIIDETQEHVGVSIKLELANSTASFFYYSLDRQMKTTFYPIVTKDDECTITEWGLDGFGVLAGICLDIFKFPREYTVIIKF